MVKSIVKTNIWILSTGLFCLLFANPSYGSDSWDVNSFYWVVNSDLRIEWRTNLSIFDSDSEDDQPIAKLFYCSYGTPVGIILGEPTSNCPSWMESRYFVQVPPFNSNIDRASELFIRTYLTEEASSGNGIFGEGNYCSYPIATHPELSVSAQPSLALNFISPAAVDINGDYPSDCDFTTAPEKDVGTSSAETMFEFSIVRADSPEWVEYVLFLHLSETGSRLFDGTPSCSDEAIESLQQWSELEIEVNYQGNGARTVTSKMPFDCINFKIPLATESMVAQESTGREGGGLQAELALDEAFSTLTATDILSDWSSQVGVRTKNASQGGSWVENESCGTCSEAICYDSFFVEQEFVTPESSTEANRPIKFNAEADFEDCGVGSDCSYYLQLRGLGDYYGMNLSVPLNVDWDGDGYPSEQKSLCDIQQFVLCDELDCSQSCNLEQCMACMVDCDATTWDCDDRKAMNNPEASEICDGNDNDCDGKMDEGLALVYPDMDGDGFGSGEAADCSTGMDNISYVQVDGDCDDNSAMVYPGAPNYLLQDSETGEIFDNDCVPGLEVWQESLFDSNYDGFTESVAISMYQEPSLEHIVNLMAETNRAVEEFGLPNTKLKVMSAVFLKPGFYHAQVLVSGFDLELRAEPGTARLFPSLEVCETDCFSTLVAYDGASVLIDGLTFEEGTGTSDSVIEAMRTQTLEELLEQESSDDVILQRSASGETDLDSDDIKPTSTDFPTPTEEQTTGVPAASSGASSDASLPGATVTVTPTPTPTPTDPTQILYQYCIEMAEYVEDLRWGGALLTYNSRVIIRNTEFSENQAHVGAAIALLGGPETSLIRNSNIHDNIVLDPKWSFIAPVTGTVYVEATLLEIFDSAISNNRLNSVPESIDGVWEAGDLDIDCVPHLGAGLGIYYGNVSAFNNVFANNIGDYGAAITALGTTGFNTIEFYNNTIVDNESLLGGGALFSLSLGTLGEPTFRFYSNILSGNRSYGIAGAGMVMGSRSFFSNNLISGNIGTTYGGLLFVGYQRQNLANLSFDRNRSLTTPTDGTLPLGHSDLDMIPLEDLVLSVERELLLEDEIASTLRLLRDVELAELQFPTHASASAQAQDLVATDTGLDSVKAMDGSYIVSDSLFTPLSPIELTRTCGTGVDYLQMAWLPNSAEDNFTCDSSGEWLRLGENPYKNYSLSLSWTANDYHLATLVAADTTDEDGPSMAQVEDYQLESLGVYGGSGALKGREAGAFYSKCLASGEGFNARLQPANSIDGTLSHFGSVIQWADGNEELRDAYVVYLEAGQQLALDVVSSQFTASLALFGPEALSFKEDIWDACDLSSAQTSTTGHLEFVAESSGYHSLFVGSQEGKVVGDYSLIGSW